MAGWVHHIDITDSDLAAATEFYDRVLPLMGFTRGTPCGDSPVWTGAQVDVSLQRARSGAPPHDRYAPGLHHLAFGAPSRAAVDRLHDELQRLRIEIFDAPAEYPHYAPGYYAVFFAGPDGVKLEYVHTPHGRA